MINTWEKLVYRIPLILEGFEPLYADGQSLSPSSLVQLQLNDYSYQLNFELFKTRIFDAIGNKYFPIYRMADGEFNFIDNLSLSRKNLLINSLSLLNLKKLKTCWGENYSFQELRKLKSKFAGDLRKIAENGFLAIHFVDGSDYTQQYFHFYKPVTKWMDENSINISDKNYSSFYYVYALLTGNERFSLYKDRIVLIITSLDKAKEEKLRIALSEMGASSVLFYSISSTKAMLEKLELDKIKGTPDIILTGAGIGAVSILSQLEPLKTLCIDAGIVLERYINPELSKTRIFIT